MNRIISSLKEYPRKRNKENHLYREVKLTKSSKSCSPSGASTANIFFFKTASCISVIALASSVTEATSMVRLAQPLDSSYINYDGQLCGKTMSLGWEMEGYIQEMNVESEKEWDLNVNEKRYQHMHKWKHVHTDSLNNLERCNTSYTFIETYQILKIVVSVRRIDCVGLLRAHETGGHGVAISSSGCL